MSEKADIVARLRTRATEWDPPYSSACEQAADEIERLRDERGRATAAMRVAIGEELWGLGHPAYVVTHLREELAKVTRLWKEAACALATAEAAALERAAKVADQFREQLRLVADMASVSDAAAVTAEVIATRIRALIPAGHSPAPAGEAEVERVAIALSMADPDERGLPEGVEMAEFYRGLARVAIAALASAQAQREAQP